MIWLSRFVVAVAVIVAAVLIGASTAVEAAQAAHHAAKRPPAVPPGYAERAEVRAFIAEMAAEHGFDAHALRQVFAAAKFQPQIVAAMQRPLLEPPKWYEYAPQFLALARIEGGVAFWKAHAAALERAEGDYGVPPEIIVAIVGVETRYGRNTGRHRVVDALTTLAFDYPRRAAFFRGELKHFLLLARDLGVAPLSLKGSFAGAIGLPQFMPGSYRNFAVDFDNDGRIDLWNSADDAVGSVANYLARHDWLRGEPVLLPAAIAADHRDAVVRRLDGGLSERRSPESWAADGVAPVSTAAVAPASAVAPVAASVPAPATAPIAIAESTVDSAITSASAKTSAFAKTSASAPGAVPATTSTAIASSANPVGLLLLEEGPADGDASYWIAANNFYVITRYNRSRLYAAAVWHLAQAVKAAYAAGR